MSCPKCGEDNPEGSKFCSQCQTDLTTLSEYDQPEGLAKYQELLVDVLGDGKLEAFEEKGLEKARGLYKISFARDKQMQAELGGSTDAPLPVEIYIDGAEIEKFHVGGTGVFSFQFVAKIEDGLRSVSLAFEDTDTSEQLTVKTGTIELDHATRQQKVVEINRSGGHEITGVVTVVPFFGEMEQFTLEPFLYRVAHDDQSGETNVTLDMSSMRVADLSGLQIGSSESASGSSVVTDEDSKWYPLGLIRTSAGVETVKQELKKLEVVQGTLTLADGAEYVGEIMDNEPNGQGTMTYADGSEYVGEWKDGKYNGQGTHILGPKPGSTGKDMIPQQWKRMTPPGSKYVGEWKDGEKHGQGTFTNGCFGNDELSGKGAYTYVGEWKNDKQHGQGSATFADGDAYVGGYKDNMMHGEGTHTYADGRVKEGVWVDREYVGEGVWDDYSLFIEGDEPNEQGTDADNTEDGDLLDEVFIVPLVTEVLWDIFAHEDNWFLAGTTEDIPEKKLKNAIKAYGTYTPGTFSSSPPVSIENEEVVALIDGTVFGSAKEGILFGSKSGLYFKTSSHNGHLPYSVLAVTPDCTGQPFNGEPEGIFRGSTKNAVVVSMMVLECFEADLLLEVLLELRSKLRDAAGLSDG